jgi:hypothetical protein
MTNEQPKMNLLSRLDNPAAFIAQMAEMLYKSPIVGLSTPGDAAVLAWHCLANSIDPLEFSRRYHVIGGKLSMRADYMHAAFRAAGGRIEWINTGDDGQAAVGDFYDTDGSEKPVRVTFTIEDARRLLGRNAKHNCDFIDVPGGQWTKDRGAMLRARCISKGLRMVAPEVVAGVYTPDELETITTAPPAAIEMAPPAAPARLTTTPAVIEAAPVAVPEPTPAPAPATEAAPAEVPAVDESALPATVEMLQELVALGTKLQKPDGTLLTVAEVGAKLCAAAGVTKPQDATRGQVQTLIGRIRAALSQ